MSIPTFAIPVVIILVAGMAFTAGWSLPVPWPGQDRRPPLDPITARADIKRTFGVGAGPVAGIAYSPDGSRLAAATSDGGVVVRDAPNGREESKRYTPEYTGAVTGLIFSTDGRTVAVSTSSGYVLLWPVSGAGARSAALEPPAGRGSAVTGTAFSHDARTLAVANSQGVVRLWDVRDPRHPRVMATPARLHSVTDVAFDHADRSLAVGSIDGTIQLWDVRDPRHPEVLDTLHSGQSVTSVGYSPDGSVLAAGRSDGTTRFWDVHDPSVPRPYTQARSWAAPGDIGSITGLTFTDGSRLAASTAGGYVQVWNLRSRRSPSLLRPSSRSQAFTSLSYDTTGSTLAIGVANGTVQVWSAGGGAGDETS
ncbi:hypothetical protein ABZX39_36185 [Streptomyces collinus]|uniref:WD40 repeat domain-containing protein n=1 Tax=Streptomyces collinus TaxID=42684 RepID=UPI0033B49B3A